MIKNILIVILLVTLSGCASILPPDYDNNEYYILARLETHSRFLRDECPYPKQVKQRLYTMLFDAELLNSYAYFLPRNSETYEISKILRDDVAEMQKRYDSEKQPSITYCKMKSKLFTAKARRIMESTANIKTAE